VVVLGPVGANFGAGMTGGRAYLYDPTGRHTAALDERSVQAVRLATVLTDRLDGQARLIELIRLLDAQRAAGSALAGRLLDEADLAARFWLVEPIPAASIVPEPVAADQPMSQPDRNPTVPVSASTPEAGVPSLDATWGSVTPR
jgi:glutamate synthase domain-containing protein 3